MSSKGIAIVTGSSQGIGKAIALRLAQDGFDLAINDIPSANKNLRLLSDDITQNLGRKVLICIADVSVDSEVKAMVDKVVDQLGGVDVVSLSDAEH